MNLSRLGLIIPKRYLKRAVDRNRAKRELREAFRLRQADLVGLDLVMRLKAKPTSKESDLRVECNHLLDQSRRCLRLKTN